MKGRDEMALYTIKNELLTAQFESHGAELRSLKGKTEYMWSGDAKYWGRVSPVLFPFIGKTNNMEYHINSKCYPMTAHGFARDMEFCLLSQTEDEIWFYLESNENTLRNYPFEFRLELGYKLIDDTLEVLWRVINPSSEVLPFSIGGHPAFVCPPNSSCKQEECYLKFDKYDNLKSTKITDKGLKLDEYIPVNTENGYIHITKELMDLKTVLFENSQLNEVSLCDKDKKPYVTVSFDAPVLTLWTPIEKNAPFFCIEPWYGVCDFEGYTGDIKDRSFENLLEPNSTFNASYKIKIHL